MGILAVVREENEQDEDVHQDQADVEKDIAAEPEGHLLLLLVSSALFLFGFGQERRVGAANVCTGSTRKLRGSEIRLPKRMYIVNLAKSNRAAASISNLTMQLVYGIVLEVLVHNCRGFRSKS